MAVAAVMVHAKGFFLVFPFLIYIQLAVAGGNPDFNFQQKSFIRFNSKHSRLVNANFIGAIISSSSFENFSFQGSSFAGARITNTKFKGGDFINVDFSDAFITDSEFSNCILPANFNIKAIAINVKIKDCKYR